MMAKKYSSIIIVFFALLLNVSVYGQSYYNLVPYSGPGTFLVEQIRADTTTNGIVPDRVYVLQPGGLYLNTEVYNVPGGTTMRIQRDESIANDSLPIIFQYPTGTGANPHRPPGNLFVLQGGNLDMSNLAVTGYFEPIDSNINNVQGGLINTTAEGSSITIDGCLLTNINGQHVRTGSATLKVRITNSIFANMGALSSSNLGAGKGIDLREASCDSLILVNNTFVNFQDRAIRHYNFANPLAGTGGLQHALIDHNTFVNGFSFHGLLSLGNVGEQITITNNLFADAFAGGEDPTDTTRAAEWANTGETYPDGVNRMSWIFTAPNDTTNWTISNNYYTISDSGQAFMTAYGVTEGSQLSWHINSKLGADSVYAFYKEKVNLVNIPKVMLDMIRWYWSPTGGNKSKNTPSSLWNRATDDMDRRGYRYYLDTLDCSYPTTTAAYTGATGGYPVGDLNWFPDKKAEWQNGTNAFDITVDGVKDNFYSSLVGPDDGYLQLRSYAYNGNGAPVDDADLSAKLWSAWDNGWLYLYAEVMDDTLAANATNVWEEDEIELKFDPQPTDSTVTSIYEARLTILGLGDGAVSADSLNAITNRANKRWNRTIVPGGYALELAIRWPVITTNSETISPAEGNVFGSAINFHDNDGSARRQASVQWAAVLDDAVWNNVEYLGTVQFLADHKLKFIPTNNMTGRHNSTPYDGSAADVEQTSSLIPKEFSMNQNYPNPFNPSTTIEFALPKQAYVELEIFNLLGERITVLISEELNAGYYKTSFDAYSLPSGIYFYRIQAGSFVQTRKLMLLK